MAVFFIIVFWVSILGIMHTYLFYPVLLRFLAKEKPGNLIVFENEAELPFVSVVMSVYNEEKVLADKMKSLLEVDYPKQKIQIFVGSDASSDKTESIMQQFSDNFEAVHFFPFRERRGKPRVINELSDIIVKNNAASPNHVFLITDANVLLHKHALKNMARHFKNRKIALVDSHMVNTGMKEKGISKSEQTYISGEVMLKNREGKIWGTMIGPFGGCYALRSDYFSKVPPNFLVDDFYIAMRAMEKGARAINDLDAVCMEAVSHEIREEYRRKSRISAGNFQNLYTFSHLLWPLNAPLSFAFFSHKVLRWVGPFFILAILLSSAILGLMGNKFYLFLFLLFVFVLFGIPILDRLLILFEKHILLFRNITYFNYMNLALLEGFFKFIKGIKNNVWEPPKRV